MDKRNATRSWSGYVHQGRVGLLVALRELRKLISSNEIDAISHYSLIYENAEDFDIQKDDQVISRHQVKCYKDGTSMSAYRDVLSIQVREFKNNVWTIKCKGFQVDEYKSDGTKIESVVDENSRYLHTIKEVPGFGLSEEDFNELKRNNPKVSSKKYYSNPNNIQLYEYEPEKKYCGFKSDSEDNDLRKYCQIEIEEIMKLKQACLLDETDIVAHRYNQLLDILDDKISKCHANIDDINYPILAFQELLDAVIEDKHIEPDILRDFRKLISQYWDEYHSSWINGLTMFPSQVNEEDFERTQKVLNELVCFTDSEFKKFIYQIQTTKKNLEDKIERSDLNSLCTESQIKQIFFKVLLEVKRDDFSVHDSTYRKDGGYVLTLINKEKNGILEVARDIIDSRTLLQNIYEKEFLITQNISEGSVLELFKDDVVVENANNWDINSDIIQKMDIRKSKLRFISVLPAIDKLNGENDD